MAILNRKASRSRIARARASGPRRKKLSNSERQDLRRLQRALKAARLQH